MTPDFQTFIKVLFFVFTNVIHFGCKSIGKLTLIFFYVNQGQRERNIQSFLSSLMSHTIYTAQGNIYV